VSLQSVGFYLENLLPGVAILLGAILLFPPLPAHAQDTVAQLQKSEFLLSVSFLTVAY
jgi:hypothetical protein